MKIDKWLSVSVLTIYVAVFLLAAILSNSHNIHGPTADRHVPMIINHPKLSMNLIYDNSNNSIKWASAHKIFMPYEDYWEPHLSHILYPPDSVAIELSENLYDLWNDYPQLIPTTSPPDTTKP